MTRVRAGARFAVRAGVVAIAAVASACTSPRPFPLREPLRVDTDLRPVGVPCRLEGDAASSQHWTCAPREYASPFLWDQLDNLAFAPLSRTFSAQVSGEAVNVNSLDEVPDSAWFTNRLHPGSGASADAARPGSPGACKPEDVLPTQDQVADHAWRIDHGKDNGATLGFRIAVPGKGLYMLKADEAGKPERASAASVIGAALYHAIGFHTTCEQIVVIRKAQLELSPGLALVGNDGISRPFDGRVLDHILATTTHLPGDLIRMQASKWLPGLTIGPFRYIGTRPDDPNDVIDHADRRELRGSRVLAAWLDHWDAREQNSMDVWLATGPGDKRSSPGRVLHYLIDLSDTLGGETTVRALSTRLGYAYDLDLVEILRAFVTFGAEERPWDRARRVPGREQFAFFRAKDFDPEAWKPLYPNPAFLRMTERDAAWMARLVAQFSAEDIRRFVALGAWTDPTTVDYLTTLLVERQRRILTRYLATLSPLGALRAAGPDRICATDFARLAEVFPPAAFRYRVVEHGGGQAVPLRAEPAGRGELCFQTRPVASGELADADPARIVTFEVENGTSAGPLVIHAYDLGARGMRVVGVTRPRR